MKRSLLVAFSLALTALAPKHALAQDALVVSTAIAPLSSLRRDAVLRLSTQGKYTIGRFARATNDSLYLVASTVSLSALDSVWVRGRNSVKGAVIGAIVAGPLFALIGIAASEGWCERDCASRRGSGFTPIAIGMASAALLGAGLGSLNHVWRRVRP